MRKLCPNSDREDGLDTVLEVPIPEEMFAAKRSKLLRTWMRLHINPSSIPSTLGHHSTELQFLLGVIGAPLVPFPIPTYQTINHRIRDDPIEASMAKYIVQQYVAASGGEKALDSIISMYAVGKVRMTASEFRTGNEFNNSKRKSVKVTTVRGGEMGGFVLWQKKPELWCLELVVSGYKMSAGSDGKVAWRQTPWHQSHASRGPPRPLRRSLQGLDPWSTANLFSNAVCIGEKTINGEDCFILRLDAETSSLIARSSNNLEIIRHIVWGYFSHRTCLLVQLQDSHLLRIKATSGKTVYWETTMESSIEDYMPVDGIYIGHAGRSSVTLIRSRDLFANGQVTTQMEETWTIEEVDFNIRGLSMDCFLPPSDLKRQQEGYDIVEKNVGPLLGAQPAIRMGSSKIVDVESDDCDDRNGE